MTSERCRIAVTLTKRRLTQPLDPIDAYLWTLSMLTFGPYRCTPLDRIDDKLLDHVVHSDSVAFTAYESKYIRYPRAVGTLGSLPSVPRYEEGCTTAVRVHPLIQQLFRAV